MPGIVPALRSALLTPIRNGDRTVLWARPDLGFANLLYLWMVAAARRARGDDVVVRHQPVMDTWLPVLPRLRELTVDAAAVRFRDRRDLGFHQAFGTDFIRDELERFRGMYSFDVAAYVRAAVAESVTADGPVGLLRVVSDDPEWCRLKLPFLAEHADRVEHLDAGQPHEHFRALAASRRLVLANSTFSYWGAYVSNVVHGDNHAQVRAPWFHRRDIDGGRAWHLDPRWSVVRDIPGGWDG